MDIIKISTDGTAQHVTVDDVDHLAELQGLVGGWVERIALADDIDLIGNEEAKLVGSPVRNHLAEQILGHFGAALFPGDYLAGDMLLVGVSGSDWTSTPEAASTAFAALGVSVS